MSGNDSLSYEDLRNKAIDKIAYLRSSFSYFQDNEKLTARFNNYIGAIEMAFRLDLISVEEYTAYIAICSDIKKNS